MCKERLMKMIGVNAFITDFNFSIAGMTIWSYLGLIDMVIYSSGIKMSSMMAGVITGYVQQRISSLTHIQLKDRCLLMDIITSVLYGVANILIVFNFYLGLALLIGAKLFNGFASAFRSTNRYKMSHILCNGDSDKITNFGGKVTFSSSLGNTIGMGCNILIFFIANKLNIPTKTILEYLLIIHGIFAMVDLFVSIIEHRGATKFYNTINI